MSEQYQISVPRDISPSVIQALMESAINLRKRNAPKEHIRMTLQVTDSLEKQFCGDETPTAASAVLCQWGLDQ